MGTCTLNRAPGPEAPRGTALRTERGSPSRCPHVTWEWGLQPSIGGEWGLSPAEGCGTPALAAQSTR